MAEILTLTMIFSGLNILLISLLLYVYIMNALKASSTFTLGLIIFGVLFLFQNILSFYFIATMMPYFSPSVEPYALVLTMLQTFAFASLSWSTWR